MTVRSLAGILVLPFLLSLVLAAALTLSCLIPTKAIERNTVASARAMLPRGGYPRAFGIDSKAFQLDYYTESIMLNIAYCVDPRRPFYSAMADSMVVTNRDWQTSLRLGRIEADQVVQRMSYARYWHGYLVYLRPLLVVLDRGGILILFGTCLATLTLLVVLVLGKRGIGLTVPLLLSLLLTNVLAAAQSLALVQTYVIGMAFALWAARTKGASEAVYLPVFALSGALTVFFDWLTAPPMTWGLPAVVLAHVLRSEGRMAGFRDGLRLVAGTGAAWGYAYVATWSCKWILGEIALEWSVVGDAVRRIALEGGTTGTNVSEMLDRLVRFKVPGRISAPLLGMAALLEWDNPRRFVANAVLWALLVAIAVTFLLRFGKANRDRWFVWLLLVIALTPYLWYAGTAQHTMRHYWFTYRGQLVTILAVACAWWHAVDWSAVAGTLRPRAPRGAG